MIKFVAHHDSIESFECEFLFFPVSVLTLDDDYPDHEDVINCFPAGSLYLDESVVKELQEKFDRLKRDESK